MKVHIKPRDVKTRAVDLSNASFTAYLCKPVPQLVKSQNKLVPKQCKIVYIACNAKEQCSIDQLEQLELLQAPELNNGEQ